MSLPVSVVIPVYNGERYLAEAIESVLAQRYQPLEIVVVDDGSTDGSAAIAASYPAVHVLEQPNAGIGAARNRGVSAAAGSLLAFLDCDDLWTPGKLDRQVDVLRARPHVDIVFGHVKQFVSPDCDPARFQLEATEPVPGYVAGAMLVGRSSFERVGPFAAGLKLGEFIDWHARATEAGLQSLMLPEVVLLRRLHAANTGIREKDARLDYARVVRAALQRRRAAGDAGR